MADLDKLFGQLGDTLKAAVATPQTPVAKATTPGAAEEIGGKLELLNSAVATLNARVDALVSALQLDLANPENNGPVMKMVKAAHDAIDAHSEAVESALNRIEHLESATAKPRGARAADQQSAQKSSGSQQQSGMWDDALRKMRGGVPLLLK